MHSKFTFQMKSLISCVLVIKLRSLLFSQIDATEPHTSPASSCSWIMEVQWGMLQRTMLQRTNATTNECYNEQFLSIKLGCYNEHRCYNERGRILSVDVTRRAQGCSIIVFTKERLFMRFKFTCRVYKIWINFILFYTSIFYGNFALDCGPGTDYP